MSMEVERFDVEKHRERLRKMSDEELLKEGRAAKYICSPAARYTKEPRPEFHSVGRGTRRMAQKASERDVLGTH